MQENGIEILKKIEDNGYEAYIVGGFVRDYLMNKESFDIDICTNATPQELSSIFGDATIPTLKYGAVTLDYKKYRYEITTFRLESSYDDYRHPDSFEHTNQLIEDLKRRDFTINTFCMNSKGEVIDLLGGTSDLNSHTVRTVGDPDIRFREDVLRLLRAVRFATTLNFEIDEETKQSIIKNRHLLTKLSYNRKKEELTKIFTSPNVKTGINLLIELKLDEVLKLSNLNNLIIVNDILGIWAQLGILDIYPFSNNEKEIIIKISDAMKDDIDQYSLYNNGLYIMSIVASIKGFSKTELTKMYEDLYIESRSDINININELCSKLEIKPGNWIKEMYLSVEKAIISGKLKNEKEDIYKYVLDYLKHIES